MIKLKTLENGLTLSREKQGLKWEARNNYNYKVTYNGKFIWNKDVYWKRGYKEADKWEFVENKPKEKGMIKATLTLETRIVESESDIWNPCASSSTEYLGEEIYEICVKNGKARINKIKTKKGKALLSHSYISPNRKRSKWEAKALITNKYSWGGFGPVDKGSRILIKE